MAAWEQFGEIANVVQLTGLNAVSLIGLIVKAASTARMHKQNCRQFAQHVKMIGNLLEQLKISEMRKYPETREPLEQLEDALRRAYLLVNSCQERSYLYLMAMGWNIVYQFRRAQEEIDRYLRIIPLIALIDNARVKERIEEIQRDQREYTLDDDYRQVQVAISENDTVILKKSISCSYPNLPFDKALEKEHEKLKLELQNSQAHMDVGQCEVIERLIEVTESAANSVLEKGSPSKSPEKSKTDKETFSGETNTRKYDSSTSPRETTISSGHNVASTKEAIWQEEWHSDLLGHENLPLSLRYNFKDRISGDGKGNLVACLMISCHMLCVVAARLSKNGGKWKFAVVTRQELVLHHRNEWNHENSSAKNIATVLKIMSYILLLTRSRCC
ncbi:UNVERIFIED_CONTAM: Cell number regulator 13 [Sesamum radiatum]|uniref:Cell number regulator 13 n=1 Tax=Sesamum radiatum TaxID=300843 RepID=A0AAW2SJK3_SESRA